AGRCEARTQGVPILDVLGRPRATHRNDPAFPRRHRACSAKSSFRSHSSKTARRSPPTLDRATRGDHVNCIAFLSYHDAATAIDWLEHAFGFERSAVHDGPDGTVAHAELRYEDGMVMLGQAYENDFRLKTARELGAVSQGVYVIVGEGIDAHYERARA